MSIPRNRPRMQLKIPGNILRHWQQLRLWPVDQHAAKLPWGCGQLGFRFFDRAFSYRDSGPGCSPRRSLRATFWVWRSASMADPRVIEIAREGQQGSRQDAFCLPALHRGQRTGHRASAPVHATARGGSAPPLIRESRRPAKTGHSRIHRICGDASVGLAWAKTTRFLRRRVQSWGIPRKRQGGCRAALLSDSHHPDRCEDGNLFRPGREVGEPQNIAGRRLMPYQSSSRIAAPKDRSWRTGLRRGPRR
jgi:hypothetical protein